MFFYICLTIAFIPLLFIYPCVVVGRRNIPRKGRMILAPNHQTLNDPVILASRLIWRRRFKYMAKAPLFKNKLFGALLRSFGAYPVDNKSATDLTAVKTTLKHLKDEKGVCIFPEGARLVSSEENQLKHGVAMFALKTNSPVVPAFFVRKTTAFVPNRLIIGKPIELHNMEQFKDRKIDKDALEEASQIIREGINTLRYNYANRKEIKRNQKLLKKQAKLEKKNTK